MKKLLLALSALCVLGTMGFANQKKDHEPHDRSARLFTHTQRSTGDVREAHTELYFVVGSMEHDQNTMHWIEIKRTVRFHNDRMTQNHAMIPLGLIELRINNRVIPLPANAVRVENKMSENVVHHYVRIPVESKLFFELLNEQSHSYQVIATNFPRTVVNLTPRENKRFNEEARKLQAYYAKIMKK